MKKKNLLLALLSSSLILASCGDDKAEDKGSKGKGNETSQTGDSNATSDPAGTSEPEISVDTRTNEQKTKELFALMAQDKSSTFEYDGYTTEYYGNEKGLWNVVPANDQGVTDYGIAVIPNYGIYDVEYDDESDEMYLNSIITPNTALKIDAVAYTTKDLGEAAASAAWSESSRTHTMSTTDVPFCNAMMCMLGLDEDIDSYGSKKVSFVVNEAGTAITNLSLDLSNPTVSTAKAQKIEGMKISKVGSTINLDFEVLITNANITPKTAWNQYEKAFFAQYYGADFNLPFPTGASYAINETLTQNYSFLFTDYGCGNLVNSYKNQVETAGLTLNTEESDVTLGIYCYDKVITAGTLTTGPITEYILFAWSNDPTQAVMYPNGQFNILAYVKEGELVLTYSQMSTVLTAHTLDNGESYWPTMDLSACTSATYNDITDNANAYYYYDGYDFEAYLVIKLYFATEAEAIAAVDEIKEGLREKKGYSDNSSGTALVLNASSDPYGYTEEYAVCTVKVAYDESGAYLGYVEVTLYHYFYEDYWY